MANISRHASTARNNDKWQMLTNTSQLAQRTPGWTTWKELNRLRTQVGRPGMNILKCDYSNEPETRDCGIKQTRRHRLFFPVMHTALSTHDLTTANVIAIGCARHWEGTIIHCHVNGGRTRMMMIAALPNAIV